MIYIVGIGQLHHTVSCEVTLRIHFWTDSINFGILMPCKAVQSFSEVAQTLGREGR